MPGALPLVEDGMGGIPEGYGGVSGTASAAGSSISAAVGAGPSEGSEHSTHLWVAGILIVSVLAVIAVHLGGFRVITDVGVTGR